MRTKLLIGQIINGTITTFLNINHKLLKFIPNGRYLTLDLKRAKININTIFDVGANIGQTAVSFVAAFPGATIYCFEPVASTFKILEENTKKYENIHISKTALGAENKTVFIYENADSEINSVKKQISPTDQKAISINILEGQSFCNLKSLKAIDLIKIDVEGYEIEVLKGFDADFLSAKVQCIYAEVGFDRSDELKTMFSDINDYLSKLGFVTSGFYEPFRWGNSKLRLGFCNVLFINTNIIKD
ncbi:FkbM family methyltransferase [Pedobacter sp. MW01-1-1]|uniref:FkbM family methyltransferase n=1 Tax=Pedobacter sp. MW01-1-1 TaxID=3383027 RepID=UPI003FEFCF45